jgi:uncharacterized protein YndB with AHSA1/START domain
VAPIEWRSGSEHERETVADRTRPDGPGFELTRVFDAPRQRVWREWTEPEAFADWYGGPDADVPLDALSWQPKPDREWRATMFFGPNRREIRWRGTFLEVEEPERLVFTVTDTPENDRVDVVTVALEDLGEGRTEMRVEQRGWMEPEQYEPAKRGWGAFFDRMAERLAT